jgi:hypothetical protein
MTKESQIESNSLLKEIKSEIKKDQIFKIWTEYKKPIITTIILVALASISWVALEVHNHKQAEKYSAILHQILIDDINQKNSNEIQADLKSIYKEEASPFGIKEISLLKSAAAFLKEGNKQKAIDTYIEINENKKFDQFSREYSGLIALKILINSKGDNKNKIISLATKLEGNSNILKYYIMEQRAIFQWNEGNFKIANEIFNNISKNPEVPASLKKRTQEMNKIYISKFGIEEKQVNSNKPDAESK